MNIRANLAAGMAATGLLVLAGCDAAPVAEPAAESAVAAPADWPYPDDIPTPRPAPVGLAGEARPSLARFMLARGPYDASLSPDGATVAFRDDVTGVPQLWAAPTSGGAPRQLTFGLGVSGYDWAPDGRLMVASDFNGDEREGYTLLSADGRSETVAIPKSDAFVAWGGFSPDGARYAYSTTARNGNDFDVHVGDVATGQQKQAYQGTFGFYAAAWRPGATEVLVSETRGEDANDLHLLNVDTGALTTLFKPEVAASYGGFEWMPDGASFYMASNEAGEYAKLVSYDVAAKAAKTVYETEADVESIELYNRGRSLAWTVNRGGYSELHLRAAAGLPAVTVSGLPKGNYALSGAELSDRLLVTVEGPTTPGEIWSLSGAGVTRLVGPRDAGLAIEAFASPESIMFPAQDGVQLNGLLYMPTGLEAGGKPPVVVMVHGGPTGQARPGFDAFYQYLLSRGVAVFDLNFRGSTGFGKTFARLDNQRLRPNAVRDVDDAVAWLKTDGRVDADAAAIMGGSYGGYLANAAVGEFPGLFKAAVSLVGVSDWVHALEEASPALKASDRVEYGDITNEDDRKFFAELSPMTKINQSTTPMIVLHGANDPRDPVTESDRLVEAVRKNGVEVQYLRFPDEGHGIRKLPNRLYAYEQIAVFLDRHLK